MNSLARTGVPFALVTTVCATLAAAPTGASPLEPGGSHVGSFEARDDVPADVQVISRNTGVSVLDGVTWGLGPDYKARFEAGAVHYRHRGGLELSFELESIQRGDEIVYAPDVAIAPTFEGDLVEYAHGAGITERYEMTLDGVEQSFLFSQPLGSSGDLIVRGFLTSFLEPSTLGEASEGLRFTRGEDYLEYGAVTGIDAIDNQIRGRLHYDGERVELVLPAAFVDQAAYPLLLDPLIGGSATIPTSTNGGIDDEPDVAYDVTNDLYLVAWPEEEFDTNTFGTLFVDIKAQRVGSDGSLIGGQMLLDHMVPLFGGFADYNQPTVASVNATDTFAVAWTEDFTGKLRSVRASDGLLSSTITLGLEPKDIGGDLTTDGTEAIVVDRTMAQRVNIPNGGTPSTVGAAVTLLPSGGLFNSARITKSGGPDGRWMMGADDFSDNFVGRVFDRTLTPLTPETILVAGPDKRAHELDGDGTQFMIAYESPVHPNGDIECRSAIYRDGALTLGTPVPALTGAANQLDPAIGFTGDSYVVVQSFGSHDIKAINPVTCDECEPMVSVSSFALDVHIGTQYAGGGGTQAMIAWRGSNDDVNIQRYDTAGQYTDLGGGCGAGGRALTSCPQQANAGFEHRLAAGSPLASAFLVLGFDRIDAACGPCTLVPNPFTGLILSAGLVGADGSATLAMPIPDDVSVTGISFYDQWVTLPVLSSPTCAALSADLSNAVEYVIE